MTGLKEFDNSFQKTMEWINSVADKADMEDKHKTFQAMKATLHALRDRLTVEEAAQLAAQMPTVLRGYYFLGWKPGSVPKKDRTYDDFVNRINAYLEDVDADMDGEFMAKCVFSVLSEKITEGEIADILNLMPKDLRSLWPEEVREQIGVG